MTFDREHLPESAEAVLLFDGVCSLCNGLVDFLIRRDRDARLAFGTLQSEAARELLRERGLEGAGGLSTVVLVTDDAVLTRSDAILRAVGLLGGAWTAAGLLRIVPRPLRDLVYRWVARTRYRIFGRRDTCRVPTPDEVARFIERGPGTKP